tara:strand:+ start:511 stop:1914 length:1404 start_codon:yes stop_codon:yes gene_type:complete
MQWSLEQIYKKRVINEDVEVSFKNEDGSVDTYKLEDTYAKILKRQIKVESSKEIDDSINKIFSQSDWTGNQNIPKSVLKDITIKSPYDQGVDLLAYLAENKKELYSLADIRRGEVFSFLDGIVNKLPQEFKVEGLDDYIRQVHMTVVPKAATSVGLGEGTFTIFGTATKGNSGDLQWGGLEVEIKTNGKDNSGAILGGDGYLNKVTDRLEGVLDYENLKGGQIKKFRDQLEDIGRLYKQDKEGAEKLYIDFQNNAEPLLGMLRNKKIENALKSLNIDQLFSTQLNRDYTIKNTQSPVPDASTSLYNMLGTRLVKEVEKAGALKTNLPSQISTFITDDLTSDDYVRIFSEFKTYTDARGLDSQLKEFFNSNNYQDFNPRVNYTKFQRLVGAIAIVSYQQKINFDLLTTGNDKKMTMAVIDCRNPSVSSIYNQLEAIPEIVFDLNIDVYEGGKFVSQTVIAKSPRIILK